MVTPPGRPQRDPDLEALLRLGRPVAGSTLTCEHRRGQHPAEEQQRHAQGQTARHPGRGASVASEREAPGTELLKLQGRGNEASKGWGGFSSMQTLSSWDTVPAPHT